MHVWEQHSRSVVQSLFPKRQHVLCSQTPSQQSALVSQRVSASGQPGAAHAPRVVEQHFPSAFAFPVQQVAPVGEGVPAGAQHWLEAASHAAPPQHSRSSTQAWACPAPSPMQHAP